MAKAAQAGSEEGRAFKATAGGNEAAFTAQAEPHRQELKIHCYRMVASFEDAEDLVQETFLRAWRARETFQGRSSFRAWLYRIATNSCLDFIERNKRRVTASSVHADAGADAIQPPPHITWLQPFPDPVLDAMAPRDGEPDAVVIAKESIELAFLVAIQLLPPKQRAVLILRDVLGWSARETAGLLETTAAAVNAALLRARATIRGHRADHADVAPRARDEEERELVRRYAEAGERGDLAGLASLLREDVRFAMPPEAGTWIGLNTVVAAWVEGGFGSAKFGDFRCAITSANRMPAVACYLRKPGDTVFRPMMVDVLEIREGKIAQITAFQLAPFLEAFGLPATM